MKTELSYRTISGAKLVKRGDKGILISTSELIISNVGPGETKAFEEEINRRRMGGPVPAGIMDYFNRLKAPLMKISGYWISAYDRYLNSGFTLNPLSNDPGAAERHLHAVMQNFHVTNIYLASDGFIISGEVELFNGKVMMLNPGRITRADDFEDYEMVADLLLQALREIIIYFKEIPKSLKEMGLLYLSQHLTEAEKQNLSNLTDSEIENMVMDKFSKKGVLVQFGSLSEESEAVVVEDFEEEPQPEPESASEPDMDAETAYTPPVEKAKDPFGKPAAEESPIESEDLTDLQYSESAGIEAEEDDFV